MNKSKEEFVHFIRDAMENRHSHAFSELYNFLLGCFIRADTDLDGKVFIKDFDTLIQQAVALPRKYGMAPKSSEIYPTDKIHREKMFKDLNMLHDGYITLEQWISFSVEHIMCNVRTPGTDYLTGQCTKAEFITFIKKSVNTSSPQYRELYFFLLKCFTDADRDHDGKINHQEFDSMIEEAAQAPRKHGLAPQSSAMFKTDAERLAKREEYFTTMDKNKDDSISFDEWLKYAMDHIIGKVTNSK